MRGVIDLRDECSVGHDKRFVFAGQGGFALFRISSVFFGGGVALLSVTTALFWQKTSSLLDMVGECFCSGVTS